MGDLHKLDAFHKQPRKISEVEWFDGSLRLSPIQRLQDKGWFWPLIATLPPAAFVAILFW